MKHMTEHVGIYDYALNLTYLTHAVCRLTTLHTPRALP
jgi:hypothetical protein